MRVTKVEGGNDLAEEFARLLGHESALADQVVEEFAARHVLQQKVAEQRMSEKIWGRQ